jgi:transposase
MKRLRTLEGRKLAHAKYTRRYAAVEYIGLDVHRHYTVMARVSESGAVLGHERVPNHLVPEMVGTWGESCRVVMEATANWGYLCDLLEAQELVEEVALAHPLQVKAIAHAKVKTDKVDATLLAQLLRADLLPRAYLAPRSLRELRDLLRLRASLVRLRVTVKNKIHAVLAKEGLQVPVTDLFGRKGRSWLSERSLSPTHRLAVDSYLAAVDGLTEQIETVTSEINRQAEEWPEVSWLCSIPGIGRYSALLILSEIGDIDRFPDGDRLAAYAGLVPTVRASGGHTHLGHIRKQGSAWLRWVLVETVHRSARRPNEIGERYRRLQKKKGSATASVAVARWLATCIYAMLKEKRGFQPTRGARVSTWL